RTVRIAVLDPTLQLSSVMNTIALLGYSPSVCKIGDVSTAAKLAKQQRNQAIQRIAVAGFGMMQVMTYATASYFGGSVDSAVLNVSAIMDPQLERFFLLVSMLVATVVVFYSGKPFFNNALSDISNRHLGMDVPVSLAILGAYLPSVYQVLSNNNAHVYFDSAVMFVFFLSVGRYIEMSARHRLTGSASDVQNLLPTQITIQRYQANKGQLISIKPTEVIAGDQIQLKQGSIVPFDAKIKSGRGQLDESLLTGEAMPIKRATGDAVLAGSKLLSGSLVLESTGSWSASSIAKVQQSIQSAQRCDKREQARSEMFSRYFVQAVLLLTAVVASVWLVIEPQRVFEICLAMLIAVCPCAFALAAPIGRSAAIHSLKRVGVLLTNNAALDSLLKVNRWCFDKTGTLTRGRPSIHKVTPLSTLCEDACLQIVACIEQESGHVLSTAFENIQTDLSAENFEETVGQGVSATVNGVLYRVGKRGWVLSQMSDLPHDLDEIIKPNKAEVILANGDEVLAIIQLHDELRSSARQFLSTLISSTNAEVMVLSGDHHASVEALCDELGVTSYAAGLLPSEKLDVIKRYQNQGDVIAMVGDGINDAPVLAAADVSIALASGSELALNNADVVLLNGNLAYLDSLTKVAQKASIITKQNLTWALTYNALALPLAAFGLLTPWIAALGMSLSSVLVVLNALRIQNSVKLDMPLSNHYGGE
ncbi:MAG: Cu2+-exporting ATPase, partial [Arenicella sp.]